MLLGSQIPVALATRYMRPGVLWIRASWKPRSAIVDRDSSLTLSPVHVSQFYSGKGSKESDRVACKPKQTRESNQLKKVPVRFLPFEIASVATRLNCEIEYRTDLMIA